MAQVNLNRLPASNWLERLVPPEQAAPQGIFPLSFMQESLWFLEEMAPGNPVYNLPEAWRLQGELDIAALQNALDLLARRHEVLRTSFETRDGKPVQVVLPVRQFPLAVTNLEGRPKARADIDDLLASGARQPFDLRRGPLARAHLFRLAAREHVLLLNLHHIISDEWSFGVLLRDLAAAYRAALDGLPFPQPELPIQYADYALWQREAIAGEPLQQHLAYWVERLRLPLPALALPTDRARPPRLSYRGRTEFFRVPKALTDALKELSRAHGVTLFTTLLAGLKTLLHRSTRQDDIVVGSPMANREQVETESLIGFFINTHALRTDLGGDPPFRELLERVRETVVGAYAHQEPSIDQVIEALRPERSPNRHPLFQVVFGMQTASTEQWELPGLQASRIELDNGGSKFDWTLLATDTGDGLRVRCEYSTDLFEPATISRLMGHFDVLLRAIAARPDRRLSEFPLLTDAERVELVSRTAKPAVEQPATRCLHEWFEAQAANAPSSTAITCENKQIEYGELNQRANRLARHLRRSGVCAETPVALFLERSIDAVVAILAVLKAGGMYVPMDPCCPAERLGFMLHDTGAPVILTQDRLRSSLPPTGATVMSLDGSQEEITRESDGNLGVELTPGNAAYVIYTSGSTGQPKGVVVTHANVVRLFTETEPWFGFNAADVWTLFHSYTFDFSVWELWGALLYGGRLVVVPFLVTRSPGEFRALLAREKVTVLNQTPSAFRQLIWADAREEAAPALSLRYVICGGEALELQSLRPWFARHGDEKPRVVNMYGITETTVHVTYRVICQTDLDKALGSAIGVPLPGLSLVLLDEHLEPVPVGVPGEICVGGAGVARGYLNRPELTRERFIPDPFNPAPNGRLYRSGDLARYTPSGELEYLGRMDHQVKIRGFRVELGEIESALNRHPAVRASLILADGTGGDCRLVAYFVPVETAPSANELREHLLRFVPEYMVPAIFMPLASLPLTLNGKVDRRALPPPQADPGDTGQAEVPPRNESEKVIAGIWCEVLRRPRVGVHDNFFHLGGHSLLATQVISRVCQSLKVELSVRALFEAPTVGGLAEAATHARPAQNLPPLRRAPGDLLARLDQLSDAEVEALLRETEMKSI